MRGIDVDLAVIENRAWTAVAPADTWWRIGGFFDLHLFLDVACARVSGDGGIGSVRRIGDAITEPLVGRSALSYTYAQTAGPMSDHAYHGCLECTASEGGTAIVYTICYDQAGIDPVRREAERERIRQRFGGAVAAMKEFVERRA